MMAWLKRWRYALFGFLIGVLLAGLVVALLFTLPVSAPLLGGIVATSLAFSAVLGPVWTGVVIAAGATCLGVLGAAIGKGLQSLGQRLMRHFSAETARKEVARAKEEVLKMQLLCQNL